MSIIKGKKEQSSTSDKTTKGTAEEAEKSERKEGSVMPYNSLGKISGILHCNNQNNWLERRVQSLRDVPWMPSHRLKHLT